MAKAFTNATLQTLWLGVNEIGVEGTRALAEALTSNATLQQLSLWKNKISQTQMDQIESLLSHKNWEKRRRKLANQARVAAPTIVQANTQAITDPQWTMTTWMGL